MKTNIKVVFKDGVKCLFDANGFDIDKNGFCVLDFIDEEDESRLVACVSMDEIKYLTFVEVEDDTEI